MKYILIILKVIGREILWGILIGTSILIVSWYYGYKDIVQLTNILFISACSLLFFGRLLFRPKGLSFIPILLIRGFSQTKHEIISAEVEPSNDETLVGLSEEEQRKYLLLDEFIVLTRFYGIGTTVVFYAVVFYFVFNN